MRPFTRNKGTPRREAIQMWFGHNSDSMRTMKSGWIKS